MESDQGHDMVSMAKNKFEIWAVILFWTLFILFCLLSVYILFPNLLIMDLLVFESNLFCICFSCYYPSGEIVYPLIEKWKVLCKGYQMSGKMAIIIIGMIGIGQKDSESAINNFESGQQNVLEN